MTTFCIIAAFLAGAAMCAAVYTAVIRRRKKQGEHAVKARKKMKKIEFSKLIIVLVLLTYFVGVYIGVKIALIDVAQISALLAYIGTPTATAIGFYCWKAKAENIIKIKRENPEETKGIPVDVNNIE